MASRRYARSAFIFLKKGTPPLVAVGHEKRTTWRTLFSLALPSQKQRARKATMDRGRMNTSTLDRVSRLASTAGDKESIDVSLAAIEWDIKLVDGGM